MYVPLVLCLSLKGATEVFLALEFDLVYALPKCLPSFSGSIPVISKLEVAFKSIPS